MFSGAVTGIFVPLLWHLVARFVPGLSVPKFDWSRLLRMDAIQPRVGDEVFALEKVDDLGHFDRDALRRASRTARWVTIVLALVFLILIPLPMVSRGLHWAGVVVALTIFSGCMPYCSTEPSTFSLNQASSPLS